MGGVVARAIAAALLIGIGTRPLMADDGGARLRYGRHLASECTSCHRGEAGAEGMAIPVLAGRAADEIAALLEDYREGRKTNPVMVSVARSLDRDATAAVAAYFASLPRP